MCSKSCQQHLFPTSCVGISSRGGCFSYPAVEGLTACVRGLGFSLCSQKDNLAMCLQNAAGLHPVKCLSFKLLAEHQPSFIMSAVIPATAPLLPEGFSWKENKSMLKLLLPWVCFFALNPHKSPLGCSRGIFSLFHGYRKWCWPIIRDFGSAIMSYTVQVMSDLSEQGSSQNDPRLCQMEAKPLRDSFPLCTALCWVPRVPCLPVTTARAVTPAARVHLSHGPAVISTPVCAGGCLHLTASTPAAAEPREMAHCLSLGLISCYSLTARLSCGTTSAGQHYSCLKGTDPADRKSVV